MVLLPFSGADAALSSGAGTVALVNYEAAPTRS
jgi:hypothetical protein